MFRKNTQVQIPQVPNPLSGHQFQQHHHDHHDLIPTHYLQSNPTILEPSTMFNGFNQDTGPFPNQFPSTLNTFAKKTTTKKGRHSKIETSQGPRDRRVRLAIGTARKFFDLQEMLGVDKPSKTLNWLLTKSKAAIKELVVHKSGNQSICETTSPSEYEECDYSSDFSKGKKCRSKDVALDLAKESRAKARARARERTKEKMCVKQLNEDRNKGLVQFRNCHQYEVPGNCESVLHFPLNYEAANHHHDLIQESSFMKRKSGFPVFGTNIPSGNANRNWDYDSYASQSNQLCAILDSSSISPLRILQSEK